MDRQLESCSKPSIVRKNPCLKPTMEKLFEKRGTTGDIKFIINGEEIHAHRCVLAALSPRYEAQFYGAMAEKDTIHVHAVSPAAFKEFLQFFYMDDVTLTLANIEDVLDLAKQSLVDELVTECINYLIDLVGLDRLIWCYRLALVYDLKSLEQHCVNYISTNIKYLSKTPDFLRCERDMLCHILSIDSLNCNETDIFDACIFWARAKYARDGIDSVTTSNLRAALGEALNKVRFNSMKFEEFAALDKMHMGFFSPQESNEIFHAIASNVNDVSRRSGLRSKYLSMECSIGNGQRARIDTPIPFQSRCTSLQCDKMIELNGLVLCSRIHDDNISVSVAIPGITHNPKITLTFSDNETIIRFDSPIPILNDVICIIQIQSKEFQKSSSNIFGSKIRNRVKQHGVTFQISGFNSALNLITRLLFNTIG